jgi:outer membrane lipoprotein-sorting protein
MFKIFSLLIFFLNLVLITPLQANNKEKIIEKLQNIENLNFEFEQNINGRIERGNCTIDYPKKIFCKYNKINNKILVSNGNSIVIKTITSFYRYPLKKTPLNFILDKDFLINKIYDLDEKNENSSFINYEIIDGDNQLNIFFDKKNFHIIGWRAKDIYQNLSITYLSSIKINQEINQDLFKLPAQN